MVYNIKKAMKRRVNKEIILESWVGESQYEELIEYGLGAD